MNDLRTKLIRLAHEKPELRAQLLPLIKEAGAILKGDFRTFDDFKKEVSRFRLRNKNKWWGAQATVEGRSVLIKAFGADMASGKYQVDGLSHKPGYGNESVKHFDQSLERPFKAAKVYPKRNAAKNWDIEGFPQTSGRRKIERLPSSRTPDQIAKYIKQNSMDDWDDLMVYAPDGTEYYYDERKKSLSKTAASKDLSKVAHKPHIREINRNTNRDGLSSMLYYVDKAKNHSKFHEMHVDGTTLKRVWGALTDRGGFGKTQSKNESFSSPEQAMGQMQKIKATKVRKGYIDTYGRLHRTPEGKALPQGQYPIGLTREVGFGWGTQESAFCIPELMRLKEDLSKHQAVLARTLPSSDMGKKILGQIKTLSRYLEKQMALCS